MERDQDVMIISRGAKYVRFAALPGKLSVMTRNCSVVAYSSRPRNTISIRVDNRLEFNGTFPGFKFTYNLTLPDKRQITVSVELNGELYLFTLLVLKRAPTLEELELAAKYITILKEVYEFTKLKAWGAALLGAFLPTPIYILVARRLRRMKVEEVA